MIAAVDATRTGVLTADAFKWKHARLPADLCLAGDGRRAPLHDGQQRHRRRLRPEDRRAAVDEDARHAAEGIAGAGRRQAVCRHRERQVLHPAAVGARASRCSTKTCSARPTTPEAIVASPIVADGRVYVTSMDDLYAIGKRVRLDAARCTPFARRGTPAPPRRLPALGPGVPVRSAAGARRQAGLHAAAVRCEGQLHPRGARRPRRGRSIR